MTKETILPFNNLKAWFSNYVRTFYAEDAFIQKNILLKEQHTFRVVSNSECLAKSLQLTEEQVERARIIGLFHDIGRFEQFRKYRTYRDGKSENHALLGLRILEETGILSNMAEADQQLIKKAIAYHNVCNLPEQETEEVLLHSWLIRDADKLDSLDVIVNYFENRHQEVNEAVEDYPDTPEYSPALVEDILHNRNISYGQVKTVNDMILTFLAWILDVKYPYTMVEMQRRKHVERLMAFLPQTEDRNKVQQHLQKHMKAIIEKESR